MSSFRPDQAFVTREELRVELEAVGGGAIDIVSNVATARILGRITAGSGDSEELTAAQVKTLLAIVAADVSDFNAAVATTAVLKSLWDANTMLYATTDNTPVPLTIAASRIVGRKATGDIGALTAAEVKTILAIVGADISDFAATVAATALLKANNLSDVASAATSFSNIKQPASETATGVVELATTAEATTGTDTTRAVTAAGVKAVADTKGPIHYPRVTPPSGTGYQTTGRPQAGFAVTLDRMYLFPADLLIGHTYTKLGVRVVAAGTVAGAVARLGIYARTTGGQPGALILDGGTITVETTANILRTVTIFHAATASGCFMAVVFQVGVTTLTVSSTDNNATIPASGLFVDTGEAQAYLRQNSVTGALPANTSGTGISTYPQPVVFYQ